MCLSKSKGAAVLPCLYARIGFIPWKSTQKTVFGAHVGFLHWTEFPVGGQTAQIYLPHLHPSFISFLCTVKFKSFSMTSYIWGEPGRKVPPQL